MAEKYIKQQGCRLLIMAIAAVLSGASSTAYATTINFETTQGYSTTGGTGGAGSLKGQPSTSGVTTWNLTNSNTSAVRIIADEVTGNQAATTSPNSSSTGEFTYKLTENNNLGPTAFNNATTKLYFSLNIRINAAPVSPSSGSLAALLRPRFTSAVGQVNGTANAGQNYFSGFEFQNDGEFAFTYDTGSAASGTYSGTHYATISGASLTNRNDANAFIASANTFFNVSGVADFSTGAFTLVVDGVAQNTGTTMYFLNTPSSYSDVYVDLATLFNASSSTISSSIDNLTIVAPEPASSAMIGCASLLLMRRRRRSV